MITHKQSGCSIVVFPCTPCTYVRYTLCSSVRYFFLFWCLPERVFPPQPPACGPTSDTVQRERERGGGCWIRSPLFRPNGERENREKIIRFGRRENRIVCASCAGEKGWKFLSTPFNSGVKAACTVECCSRCSSI